MERIQHPIILFDGICNLCNGFVQFVIKRDTDALFRFGSLQSEKAQEIIAQIGSDKQYLSTVILIQNQALHTESDAVLRIIKKLGWWRIFYMFVIIPKFIRDPIYRFISKHRYQVFGKREACMIPTPELRDRFL